LEETQDKPYLDQLIENILETRFDNFDQATVAHAKNRIIDTIGCLIGGARDAGNPEMINLFKEIGGSPEASILIYGGKVPVHNAAMINSILARSFDFEPVSPLVDGISLPGHISGSTVMTALALGEMMDISGRELITALLVGDNIAARVLIASGFEFNRGWDNIGTVNALGTTAIAGRIFGLDRHQLRNAFGIVLNQLAGSMQIVWDTTTSFKICQGLSSRNGIFSVRLARAGWTGPQDALSGEFGYFKLYTQGSPNLEALTKDLGKKYYSDGTFKPYPCCRVTHGPIDCALAIVNNQAIDTQDIEEIIIQVPSRMLSHVCGRPFTIGEFPHANAAFNIRYTVATALLRRSVKPEHFTEKHIKDPAVKTITDRIKLVELPKSGFYGVRLTIKMQDGMKFSEASDIPLGDPGNPLSKDQLLAKYWTNVNFSRSISRENAQKALDVLEKLETLNKVRDLIPFLIS
jgi:2-methylcitrate dehydratase PrpD